MSRMWEFHDHFLELGGNSLAAMQVIAKVAETFQLELPFQFLLQSSSIAEMAERVETYRWATAGPPRPEKRANVDEGEI